MSWSQCNSSNPCPICGRNRYCTYNAESGLVKCTQVSDGSYTQRKDPAGLGFFHRHDFSEYREIPIQEPKQLKNNNLDWAGVAKAAAIAPRHRLATLARRFGSTCTTLQKFGIGWLSRNQLYRLGTKCAEEGAWTFPMRDHGGNIVGFRLRTPEDFMFAIKGSVNGLFFKPPLIPTHNLLVVDGASDAFTAYRYSLHAVGRPSATGGQDALIRTIDYLRPKELHQLLDADEVTNPVRDHAHSMAKQLLSRCPTGTIFYPPHPHKDLRQWLTTTTSLPTRFSPLVNTSGRIVKGCKA